VVFSSSDRPRVTPSTLRTHSVHQRRYCVYLDSTQPSVRAPLRHGSRLEPVRAGSIGCAVLVLARAIVTANGRGESHDGGDTIAEDSDGVLMQATDVMPVGRLRVVGTRPCPLSRTSHSLVKHGHGGRLAVGRHNPACPTVNTPEQTGSSCVCTSPRWRGLLPHALLCRPPLNLVCSAFQQLHANVVQLDGASSTHMWSAARPIQGPTFCDGAARTRRGGGRMHRGDGSS